MHQVPRVCHHNLVVINEYQRLSLSFLKKLFNLNLGKNSNLEILLSLVCSSGTQQNTMPL